jgi:Holliday junction resolvasome RuvABC ATP-dependent DNA helicase subunit
MIARTPRGRIALPAAYQHLQLDPPESARSAPPSLLDQ